MSSEPPSSGQYQQSTTSAHAQRRLDQSSRQLEGILREAFHQCGACDIVMLTAEDIVTLIRERWDELSLYGHRIHNALQELDYYVGTNIPSTGNTDSHRTARSLSNKRKRLERKKAQRSC